MTSLPAEGPAPDGAGPHPRDQAVHCDLLTAYARKLADDLTLHLPYPYHFTYEAADALGQDGS